MSFIDKLEKNQKSFTENGAVGYSTTGHKLVDLNFAIPSFRDGIDCELFEESLAQDERLTLKWLLYLRDIRQGVGERKSFRDFVVHLAKANENLAIKFISCCPFEEYGRWDDYIDIYFNVDNKYIKNIIAEKIIQQFKEDISNFHNGKNVSLLMKWLPSINASSFVTRQKAKEVMRIFGIEKEKYYRKILSSVRKYIDVVERKMSANQWSDIDYEHVPSKANLNYADAFMKHDWVRRREYLDSLKNGESKINADALFLHDIVRKYRYSDYDETFEQMWKAQKKVEGFTDTIVVRDGSGSMCSSIGNSNVRALDIADAITLYCAENNSGSYKNKFITFSSKARLISLISKKTLYAKLNRLEKENDWSNTDIENVFNLILDTAIKNGTRQDELPKIVLIISDMEFDNIDVDDSEVLFEHIQRKFNDAGYDLPKLVFWNVNSRTNTIPLQQNKSGVILISGFSKNIMNMVMSSELDPYKALVKELEKPRYDVVDSIYE